MANLELKGILDFRGMLTLQGSGGGKVTAGGREVLVEQAEGTAPPVIQPPPPASPLDLGPKVKVIVSLNKTVTAAGKAIVTQGIVLQGNAPTWPGMVMRGAGTVTVNQIPMNVQNEQAVIFPSGGSAVFSSSGQ
jgi:uncharacterized Zn-binding protein involved in type VI secretion